MATKLEKKLQEIEKEMRLADNELAKTPSNSPTHQVMKRTIRSMFELVEVVRALMPEEEV